MQFVLKLSCPDGVGIAAAATGLLARHRAWIFQIQHARDDASDQNFLRLVFGSQQAPLDIGEICTDFASTAARFAMQWSIRPLDVRRRVLIAVSRQGHCLNSLLQSWQTNALPIDAVGVVSNHEEQRRLVEWYGLPFYHLPIGPEGKGLQEQQLLALFATVGADLLVLARYMQVLSSAACEHLAGRAINIHHSFLPGFKGARPYHQAHGRGVKLIGATAHFINDDLDEGPIIEQDVERVDHSMTVDQLASIGAEIESRVLNRAVRWYAEDRVFEVENRTVVLK